jgi:hypothetical protein
VEIHPRVVDEINAAEKKANDLKLRLGHITAKQMMLAHDVIAAEKELQELVLKTAKANGIKEEENNLWSYDPKAGHFKRR